MLPATRGLSSRAALLGTFVAVCLATTPAPAQQSACTQEAASIRHARSQLPRLEIAPPGDQQIVCITLETNILFARRLAAHLALCPRSPNARTADARGRTDSQSSARFGERRCKPAIRDYRG